jgi:Zn-finger nucleic acid-binding protein
MMILELEGVEIDLCYGCGGVWLDRGELQEIVEKSGGCDTLLNSIRPAEATGEKSRQCPVCRKRMEKAAFEDTPPVILDRCADHGIWLDRGELKEVITRTAPGYRRSLLAEILQDIFGEKNQKEDK